MVALTDTIMTSSLNLDNLFGLQGRIALVTGGGSGIGWMIARGLATNGVKVYITGRRKQKLEESAASFNESNQGKGSVVACVVAHARTIGHALTPGVQAGDGCDRSQEHPRCAGSRCFKGG